MSQNFNVVSITVAILCRDNLDELVKTLDSVCTQPLSIKWPSIEILIVDGSKSHEILNYIDNFDINRQRMDIRYLNSKNLGIFGIYPSMNFALDMARGQYIHFLNSGDTLLDPLFYNYVFQYSQDQLYPSCFFGQAIVHGKYFRWIFPDIDLRSINLWLKYFEPNHQAMLVLTEWSRVNNRFPLDAPIGADAVWKRMATRKNTVYYSSPVINFYLGGQSSSYNFKGFKTRFQERWRNPFQKFLEILKFLLFRSAFVSELLQLTKNKMTSILFKFL